MPSRWNTFGLTSQVSAADIRVDVTPQSGGADTGIPEVEFWGSAQSLTASSGFDVLALLGNGTSFAQFRKIDVRANTLNVSQNNSVAKIATFDLAYLPSDIKRFWLVYDLKDLTHWTAACRLLNGSTNLGGYVAAIDNSWSVQVEEINPQTLRRGANSISLGQLTVLKRIIP